MIGETEARFDDEQISHAVTVYADIGGYEHSAAIANEVEAQLRTGPEFTVDGVCDLVVPADAGAFGNELLVSIEFSDLAKFVHAVEATGASSTMTRGEERAGGELVNDPDIRATVERALKAGRRHEDIDMVVRARYAYEWGGGDALHLELADEVQRLRAIVGQP